jgi:hypothetical protein
MKKSMLLVSVIAFLLLPAFSQAADVCFQNDLGAIFRLSIRPKCRATSSKPAAVIGTMTPSAGLECLGSSVIGVHGVCFGVPSEGKVHLNLISERIDHTNPAECALMAWNLIGDGLNLLTGSVERVPDSGPVFAARTFTAIPCP